MSRLVFASIAVLSLFVSAMASPPDCDTVLRQLNPCAPYLQKTEAKPAEACCKGVVNLNKYANDKAARQAICQCLEGVASSYGGIDYSLIPGLPEACGVPIDLPPASPTFDCSKA